MQILSHRGLWSASVKANSLEALAASLRTGLGLETDIRDSQGEIVIAHDPPEGDCRPLADLLSIYRDLSSTLTLALNIKADGLQPRLDKLLSTYGIERAFVFDMSVPDTLGYLRLGVPVFTRQSEYEPEPALADRVQGVWIDAFESDWYDEPVLARHLAAGRKVCLVSPELHGRPQQELWSRLRRMACAADDRLMLCTDHPQTARSFFSGRH